MAGGAVQSVQRAVAVVEALTAAGGQASLSELVAATGLPLTTVHRLLATLGEHGLVRQTHNRLYALGPRFLSYGEVVRQTLSTWAHPVLRALTEQTSETANLAILSNDRVIYLAQSPSPYTMRTFTEVGRQVDPHCTGVGKALMSALPDDEVRAIVEHAGMEPRTSQTITTVAGLLEEMAAIRSRGYAIDDGEQEVGVRCIAVAVPTKSVRLAVSISGPSARVTTERVPELAPVVLDAADRLALIVDGREAGGAVAAP